MQPAWAESKPAWGLIWTMLLWILHAKEQWLNTGKEKRGP
jgi:hypothetical protein